MDPPYKPISSTSNFTAYTDHGFGDNDQVQLANVFRNLADRGCFVLLSNSDTPFIRELYSDYSINEVGVQRAINCKGSRRAGHKDRLFPTIRNHVNCHTQSRYKFVIPFQVLEKVC